MALGCQDLGKLGRCAQLEQSRALFAGSRSRRLQPALSACGITVGHRNHAAHSLHSAKQAASSVPATNVSTSSRSVFASVHPSAINNKSACSAAYSGEWNTTLGLAKEPGPGGSLQSRPLARASSRTDKESSRRAHEIRQVGTDVQPARPVGNRVQDHVTRSKPTLAPFGGRRPSAKPRPRDIVGQTRTRNAAGVDATARAQLI